MLPLRDDNPTYGTPWVTWALIGVNIVVWLTVQGFGTDPALSSSVCRFGFIPADTLGTAAGGICNVDGGGGWFNVFSSMFMHGSWMHILGNMWFLWIFGDNVEDVMGSTRFVLFYLLAGVAAAGAQAFSDPSSTIPMVGASGAIGGVMGAYALLFPKARVHMLIILGFFATRTVVPALFMLGYWVLLQLVSGLFASGAGGVAFWAHVGGFGAGLALALPFRHPTPPIQRNRHRR